MMSHKDVDGTKYSHSVSALKKAIQNLARSSQAEVEMLVPDSTQRSQANETDKV